MEFLITRTSFYTDGESPCKGSVRKVVEHWNTETCGEEEFNRKFSDREGLWRSKGKNHKTTKEGYITRQVEDVEKHVIEFETLEDFYNFVRKHGNCILKENPYFNDMPEIEIYDGYRE